VKVSVVKVEIYKRKGSRYWQSRIVLPGTGEAKDRVLKRISTRTVMKASAQEFAELAYRHFSKLQREGKLPQPTTKKKEK